MSQMTLRAGRMDRQGESRNDGRTPHERMLLDDIAAGFLIGSYARDVSRMTDIPWFYGKVVSNGIRVPMISLQHLSTIDRYRVDWALIGGYYYLDQKDKEKTDVQAVRDPSTGLLVVAASSIGEAPVTNAAL